MTRVDFRAADDHGHLVIGAAGPADFEAAVKVAESEHMLAVIDDFHVAQLLML